MGARPPSRAFWKRLKGRWSRKRGGATGGAPRGEGRSPALQKADRREARSLSRVLVGWSFIVVGWLGVRSSLVVGREGHRRPGPALVARRAACQRRRGREVQQSRRELADHARGPRTGAASQGRGGVDVATCPPSRHEGAGKTLRSRGPGRSTRFHATSVHGPCLPPLSVRVAISLLLFAWCGAVH